MFCLGTCVVDDIINLRQLYVAFILKEHKILKLLAGLTKRLFKIKN